MSRRRRIILPGSFQPNWRSSCILYGNAWSNLTLSGSTVTEAPDLTSNSNNMTATGSLAPTLLVSDPNMKGGSSLQFAGAQKLASPSITISQPNSVIVVARFSSLTGSPGLFDNQTIRQFMFSSSGGSHWGMYAGATSTGGTPDTNMHTFAAIFNGASSALYVDGVQITLSPANPGSNNGTGGFSLGNQSTGYMTGEIQEWAIYEEALPVSYLNSWVSYVQNGTRPSKAPPSSLVDDGNSIVVGNAASPLSLGFANLADAEFPDAQTWNVALDGETTPQCIINAPALVDPHYSPLRPNNVVLFLEVTNDYLSGSTVTQCIDNLATYVTDRHAVGWKVVMCTVLPNYVIVEADRQTINAAILAGATGADAIADIGSTSTIMGTYSSIMNATYYVGELHPTTYGHSLLVPTTAAAIESVWLP